MSTYFHEQLFIAGREEVHISACMTSIRKDIGFG